MDSSNSIPSSGPRSGSSAPFAYQTRLLERTASRGGSSSLSRSNSQSSISLLTNNTGSSTGPASPRRWTHTHRPGNSLDAVWGKWEERSREEPTDDGLDLQSDSVKDGSIGKPSQTSVGASSASPSSLHDRTSKSVVDQVGTPKYLKRRTMPAPIIASPLSPNTTGVTVEAGSPLSTIPHRIHLPPQVSSVKYLPATTSPDTVLNSPSTHSQSSTPSFHVPLQRANTYSTNKWSPPISRVNINEEGPTSNPKSPKAASASLHNLHTAKAEQKLETDSMFRALPRRGSTSSLVDATQARQPLVKSPPPSVMHQAPYRSSYMMSKKSGSYGGALSAGGQRRLGNHLPRIASGDGDEKWADDQDTPTRGHSPHASRTDTVREERLLHNGSPNVDLQAQNLAQSGIGIVDGVAGLPGRLQLKAPSLTPTTTPTSRLLGGSWVDKQRHLLHAYEYLCHVGEAQQWIEGCLGERLQIGVVELEEGLCNGVVLAKLVRAFKGGAFVGRIYETSKFAFRFTDNINIFFRFLEEVGLPEGFIFELTDLYDKKNLPKVIYCIHALSHLLACRGMARRIGNLLGQLQFSDDQLQQTQKGLKEAGVTMPNFGNVGRELAKEINEEPETETEDELRERLLLENESSIIAFQATARGYLSRKVLRSIRGRMRLAERHISKLQAQSVGYLTRQRIGSQRQLHRASSTEVVRFQARCRAVLVRRRWNAYLRLLGNSEGYIIQIQAQLRGVLQRRSFVRLKGAFQKFAFSTKRLQAAARGHLLRHSQQQLAKSFFTPSVTFSVVVFQAQARGVLLRNALRNRAAALQGLKVAIIGLQAHCRGLIMRRRRLNQMARLEDAAHVVIRIQAAVRTYLARKRLLALIRGLKRATSVIIGLQTRARANLIRQQHRGITKALLDVKTIQSVGRLQALAKASLVRKQHRELDKKLEITADDIVAFQCVARGALLRVEYQAWRDHLHRSHPVATILQAMLRGTMQRRAFRAKMEYYRANLSKVVKIQSLFRAKEMREQYRQLTLGKNVTVGTIKNFVHLLDDSEADFQEEIKVERLRKRVVEHIRENQALENDVHDLDTRIALVVQNLKSFEEVIKARKLHGDSAAMHAARVKLLADHGDPFSGPNTLDQDARRKLELYQQLFYLLQTRAEYLTHLLTRLSEGNASETNRQFIERVILTLFGYGQDHREDFLLLKFFQLAIKDEISAASSVDEIISNHPIYINIAVHYVRPRQLTFVRDAFQAIIRELFEADDVDLEADPSVIHRARIEVEEMRSGKPTTLNKDLPFRDAVTDPDTRAIYIRHLQLLQWWTEAFINAMVQSTKKMPYSMRYLVRETLLRLRENFPNLPEEEYATCIGRLVFFRYINPALVSPEIFDIIPKTINMTTGKKNLAQISKVLAQISSGVEFDDNKPSFVPINDFVRKAAQQMSSWFLEVANIADAETQFHAHEFLDATVQPKPIYVSPNEIYTMHSLLLQHRDSLAVGQDDTLKVILAELGGVPHLDNEDLKEARDTAITLELTNRFSHVRDPHAEEKTLWVQAKRGVLAILRVQPAQDLLESLMRPVTETDEVLWEEILEAEIENEMRQIPRRQPSTAVNDSAYRLEDIRSLKFAAVKALAISNLLELEKQGKITREDGFQGILNAIAGDVRSKHRKRLQRQQEMGNMNEVLRQLSERKRYFEEQIDSYHNYVETAMNTMQRGKGKKRFVLPFTKQFFHLRDLQKSGQTPQFGSYLYSAKELYDRGILLSIDQYSPRQFDKIQLTMSSDRAGIFTLLLESTMLGVTSRIATEDVRMEDLLQAKYEKRPSLALFDTKVKVNFELFLFQINKKFYA